MLDIKELNVAIQGVPILQGVDFHMGPGSMVGLIGRNGAGKTTFMRSVMGFLDVKSGAIEFDGTDLLAAKSHTRANLEIGYLPEDRRLIPQFTVEENMMVPLWATGRTEQVERLEWVYELMPEIARFRDRQAMSLSGGQQKLVALGRALVCGSRLLLLDEPFEGVAPALAQRLIDVIATLREKDISVLISESDYTHSKDLVNDVYVIERGQMSHQ